MKKSELRSIIKEEILKLNESKLSDFVDSNDGKTEIWYVKPEYSRYASFGVGDKGIPVNKNNLNKTHKLLGRISEKNLEKIFVMMQGENWGNGKETNEFLKKKKLNHTSMMVGDIVKIGNTIYIASNFGFKKL